MNDEELEQRFRAASAAHAGAPGAATRAAILRRAATEAAMRASLPKRATVWPWRAAAALATVGVGAWLWLQLRTEPLTAPPVLAEASTAEPAVGDARALAVPSSPPPAAASEAVTDATAVVSAASAPAESPTSFAKSANAARLGETREAAGIEPAPALLAELARRFPEAWQSEVPVPGLWVRLDAAGQVIASGMAGMAGTASTGGASTTMTVLNARGARLELTVYSQP